jgi:hypothetical protein
MTINATKDQLNRLLKKPSLPFTVVFGQLHDGLNSCAMHPRAARTSLAFGSTVRHNASSLCDLLYNSNDKLRKNTVQLFRGLRETNLGRMIEFNVTLFAVLVLVSGCDGNDKNEGWQGAKWGMHTTEVAEAMRGKTLTIGQSQVVASGDGTNAFWVQKGMSLYLQNYDLSGQSCTVFFSFDADGRLDAVQIVSDHWRTRRFGQTILDGLKRKFGPPSKENIAETENSEETTGEWYTLNSKIRYRSIEYFHDGELSITIDYSRGVVELVKQL